MPSGNGVNLYIFKYNTSQKWISACSSVDGKMLILSRKRRNNYDLLYSVFENGKWTEPFLWVNSINSTGRWKRGESLKNGNLLYFSSTEPEVLVSSIYICRKSRGLPGNGPNRWTLGEKEINTVRKWSVSRSAIPRDRIFISSSDGFNWKKIWCSAASAPRLLVGRCDIGLFCATSWSGSYRHGAHASFPPFRAQHSAVYTERNRGHKFERGDHSPLQLWGREKSLNVWSKEGVSLCRRGDLHYVCLFIWNTRWIPPVMISITWSFRGENVIVTFLSPILTAWHCWNYRAAGEIGDINIGMGPQNLFSELNMSWR